MSSLSSLARKRSMSHLTPNEKELTKMVEVLDDRVAALDQKIESLRITIRKLVHTMLFEDFDERG